VFVNSQAQSGSQLDVTVSVGSNLSTPNNTVHTIQFTTITNAIVDFEDQTVTTPGQTVTPTDPSDEVQFSLLQLSPGPFSVTIGVTDDCGGTTTVVGAN